MSCECPLQVHQVDVQERVQDNVVAFVRTIDGRGLYASAPGLHKKDLSLQASMLLREGRWCLCVKSMYVFIRVFFSDWAVSAKLARTHGPARDGSHVNKFGEMETGRVHLQPMLAVELETVTATGSKRKWQKETMNHKRPRRAAVGRSDVQTSKNQKHLGSHNTVTANEL